MKIQERDYPERLTGVEDYAAYVAEGAYHYGEKKMDWMKLFDLGMVQSFVRWVMVAWGSSTFMQDWVAGNPTEWNAIVAGMVAMAALVWSWMTVKTNKV